MIVAYSYQLVQCIAMVHLPFNEQHFWTCVIQVLTALFTVDMVLGLWDHVKETLDSSVNEADRVATLRMIL